MDTLLDSGVQELALTRDFNASVQRVFAAWTDPRQAALWWAPQDCTPLSCEIDLRPGGAWKRRMRVPDGSVITKHGVFREIAPLEQLIFTYNTDYADGTADPETVVIVTFTDLGNGRTRLLLRHIAFQTEVSRASHEGGWTSALVRCAEFVEAR